MKWVDDELREGLGVDRLRLQERDRVRLAQVFGEPLPGVVQDVLRPGLAEVDGSDEEVALLESGRRDAPVHRIDELVVGVREQRVEVVGHEVEHGLHRSIRPGLIGPVELHLPVHAREAARDRGRRDQPARRAAREHERQHDDEQGQDDRRLRDAPTRRHRRVRMPGERGADHRGRRRDHREVVRRVALAADELEPATGEPPEERQVDDPQLAVEPQPLGDGDAHEHGDHDEQHRAVPVVAVEVVAAA